MKSRCIIFIGVIALFSCVNHSNKNISVFKQKFNDKAELLANGFKNPYRIDDAFGKKDTLFFMGLYTKHIKDTTIWYLLNGDNSLKNMSIWFSLKKTDSTSLFKFLQSTGFERIHHSPQPATTFFANKNENIEYEVYIVRDKMFFTRWFDTTQNISIPTDSTSSSLH